MTHSSFDTALDGILEHLYPDTKVEPDFYKNQIKLAVDQMIIGIDTELESRYDFDYKIAESTVKSHNKVYQAINDVKAEQREALNLNKGKQND